jgi:lysozyme family protein
MKDNFEKCLALVLKSEGGFVNNPRDPGGMTNLGVTKVTYERWMNEPVTEEQMRALTPNDVEQLYREWYWDGVRGDDLPAGVDYCTFDLAVNSGIGTAVRLLQDASNTVPDGKLGPVSMVAIQEMDAHAIVSELQASRLAYLKKISTWPVFGKGWTNRVNDVTAAALEMA